MRDLEGELEEGVLPFLDIRYTFLCEHLPQHHAEVELGDGVELLCIPADNVRAGIGLRDANTYAVLSRLVRHPGSGPELQSSRLCTLLLKNGAATSVSANELTECPRGGVEAVRGRH